MSDKPVVFISHLSEEKEVALALKALLEDHLGEVAQIYVSSDDESIRVGERWLDSVSRNLKTCVAEIILCSPAAITRHWIHFEAGAGWIRDILVMPVCFNGMTARSLPDPLRQLQAVDATSTKDVSKLIRAVAEVVKVEVKRVKCDRFVKIINEVMAGTRASSINYQDPEGILRADEWLNTVIEKLNMIRRMNKFSRAHHEAEIGKRLNERIANLQKVSIPFSKDDEYKRMDRLLETLQQADRYYFALTLVAGTYLKDFFQGEYFKEYIEAHGKAVRRTPPVDINRVFLIDGTFMESSSDPDVLSDKQFLSDLIRVHDDMKVAVRIVRVPPRWAQWQTSFVVCDDMVASESYSLRDGGLTDGYWGFDPKQISHLKAKFSELRFFPDLNGDFKKSPSS